MAGRPYTAQQVRDILLQDTESEEDLSTDEEVEESSEDAWIRSSKIFCRICIILTQIMYGVTFDPSGTQWCTKFLVIPGLICLTDVFLTFKVIWNLFDRIVF